MNTITMCSQKVLVTGITGIHGWPVFRALRMLLPGKKLFGIGPPRMRKPEGVQVTGCCITDRNALLTVRKRFAPTVVVHAAGVCDLDVCEERPHWADRINRHGTAVVADVFGHDCVMMYLSTDLVFSGNNPPAGGYAEEHAPDPVSVAGKTFAAGEGEMRARARDFAIIRLGLPLGKSVNGDKGGVDWIEGRLRTGRAVSLFTDEYRSVISCVDIARIVVECLEKRVSGLFHCGGPETVSLYKLGKMITEGGAYNHELLKGLLRHQEIGGPPRIGNVALNSRKLEAILTRPPEAWRYRQRTTEYQP